MPIFAKIIFSMINPEPAYAQKITRFQEKLKKTKQQLLLSSGLRLLMFLAIILAVYLFWGDAQLIAGSILIGLVVFSFLVSRHLKFQQKRDKLNALLQINQTEIKVLHRDFEHLPTGSSHKNPSHYYSQDIDLFGKRSFFQYLNRTALKEGRDALAQIFTANATNAIETKQEAIAELAENLNFRQEFSALAQLTTAKDGDQKTPIDDNLIALNAHKFFTPKYTKVLAWLFSVLSAILIIAYFTDFITGFQLSAWFLIGLVLSGIYLKRVNKLSEMVSSMQAVFRQYHKLLELLENTTFSAELLKQNQDRIATEKKKASQILREFSKAIDALDQRNNLLFGFLGNGFLLWDLHQSAKLEKWMKRYTETVTDWFEVIAITDAYNSLGNFAFNHPNYVFPKITANNTVIKAKNAVHPLIPPEEAVTNDFKIDQDEFFIITGANMAGKSTFLRTVSLQIVMANVGLPVCATSCEYSPIKLITSMRTVDSLAEEASYFYAELSRLKFIIDELKKDRYFIVLDEILKGTNSTDKAIGSRKFLEKLVASRSTGIIATHDLSLCEVAENLPSVENHYFDAQIIDDELYFDYKFKDGICQNMNASFLLRKMEIVDD